jgi:hypothetical protein
MRRDTSKNLLGFYAIATESMFEARRHNGTHGLAPVSPKGRGTIVQIGRRARINRATRCRIEGADVRHL